MRFTKLAIVPVSLSLLASACGATSQSGTTPHAGRLERARFNQLALRLNLPLFWASDANEDGAPNPNEVRALMFYGEAPAWVDGDAFTPAFREAMAQIEREANAPTPTDPRRALIFAELDHTAPTIVETDLSALPEAHRNFATRMLNVARLVDQLYARQVGMDALQSQVDTADTASASVFRRNWGARCLSSVTERDALCSPIAGAPRQPVGVYPASLQDAENTFCATLEARPDASALLGHFTVVRESEGALSAVPYSEAFADLMQPIAAELRAAADAMTDPNETALTTYLRAAATSFETNDWAPADEAWSRMNARNSQWYVRVGPDETYWEPCSQKAGFHLTFARINQGSLVWQDRLTPLRSDMEAALAALVPQAYTAREVSFTLPDFIDITVNSGDDRDAFGATIGQSLPNWGPVSDDGRGRTVAMSNLYTDADSRARRRAQASSLLTNAAMEIYTEDQTAGLLSTILHEASHNLGPSHEYRVNGQTDDEAFGGSLASMLEELKAQSGALFFIDMLRERGVLNEQQVREVYLDSIVWTFGHISRGMYTPSGQRKAYSQLAAVQIGFLLDQGAITWDETPWTAPGRMR